MTILQIDPKSAGLPCERCGREDLRVARIVREDGTAVSHAVVCTSCHPQHTGAAIPPPR